MSAKSAFAARNTLKVLLIAAFLTLFATANTARAGMELHELDGNMVELEDYVGNGKWLLVMMWSTTCHICEEQKPSISDFHARHKDVDAQVIGIALDGMEKIDAIKDNIKRHPTSFPTLVGNIVIVASHYQGMTEESLRGTPTYLLFNPDGELVGNNPGPLRTEAIESFMERKS